MGLRLKIISSQRQALGARADKEFGANGGTIGRSLESDWVLADSKCFVSSRHASIDFRSGSYYIVDTSTNGVYVNGSEKPVGRGKPQRLFDGDKIRIGEYTILVALEDGYESTATYSEEVHVDPVEAAQRVDTPEPTSNDLVDPFEVTGVGIEEIIEDDADAYVYKKAAEERAATLALEDDSAPAVEPAKPAPKARSTRASREPERADSAHRSQAAPPKAAPAKPAAAPEVPRSGPTRALEPFFRGAGLRPRPLNEQQAKELLHVLGLVVRELILGLQENLQVRAEHKNVLRQPHTTIQARANNALKFSAGIEEALDNLLFRDADEYIPAVESVRQCFQDIRGHQQALVAAFLTGFRDYVARLEPQEIESKIAKKPSALLGPANKLKYWDAYREVYEAITQRSPGQFPQAFLDDLVQAYEAELQRIAPRVPRAKSQAT